MEFRSDTERGVVEKLLGTLQGLPDVHAHLSHRNRHLNDKRAAIDAEIDISVADRDYVLFVEVKKSLFPRDVRSALWQLQHYLNIVGNDKSIPVLAAESISSGSKQLLREQNVGYFDTGGSLFLPARGAYFYIDKPAPRTLEKSVRSVFRGKREQVLHVLLHDHRNWFSVKDMADVARVSPATVSETLIALERFDWIESRGQGPSKERRLHNPSALLDEWKKQVSAGPKPLTRRYYVPMASSHEKLIDRLDHACDSSDVTYVLTQEAAAQRYAPFLSSISRVTCRMSSERWMKNVLDRLDAREVSEGANLFIMATRSEGPFLFKERLNSAWVANPVQVYLDLQLAGGRAQEAAEHLRKEKIGF